MRTINKLMSCMLLMFAPLVAAELPPSIYTSLADSAPEALIVEVILVRTTQTTEKTTVEVKSKVVHVLRSKSGLEEGSLLDIQYVRVKRPPGWVGPSQPPPLSAGEMAPAFLSARKNGSGIYDPAAGGKSFSHQVWERVESSDEQKNKMSRLESHDEEVEQ